jgi:hypothetical protein
MVSGFITGAEFSSASQHIQRQNLAGLAFGHDFEWAAADFAIGGEPLRRYAGINLQFERLSAEGTLDRFAFEHAPSLALGGSRAMQG